MASPRSRAWYAEYLLDALEPRARERKSGVEALGDGAAAIGAQPALQRGLERSDAVERAWVAHHGGDRACILPIVVLEGTKERPPWSLPPARASDVGHERLALLALWSSTTRWATLVALARGRKGEPDAAIWELRGTVLDPERLWYVHTRPTGASHARVFLERSMDGLPVEDVGPRWDLRERLAAPIPGDDAPAPEPPAPDPPAFEHHHEALVVTTLLACAQHRNVCARPGGLGRLLALVRLLRSPELPRDHLDHADEELLSGLQHVLFLWDAIGTGLNVPIARWVRARRRPTLEAVAEWHRTELVARATPLLGSSVDDEALRRFYVRGQSLRNIGRLFTTDEKQAVDLAVRSLEASLPRFVAGLDRAWVGRE